jgi:hypothetical protein
MKVAFVNYGFFGNNSSYHIEGFARGLAERGHEVAIFADGTVSQDIPGILTGGLDVEANRDGDNELSRFLADPDTVVHGWTPREPVKKFIESLARAGLRYLIHLEDDEALVAASQAR